MRRGVRLTGLVLCAAASACGDGDKKQPAAGRAAPPLTPETAAKLVALENRGIGALERFDYTDAVAPLREASELAPGWLTGRFNLALALIHAGRENPAEAAKLLDGVLAESPDHPQANFMAGWLAERAGGPASERAIGLYRKAYELSHRDAIVGSKLGGLLAGMEGREREALEILLECHARQPALVSPVNQLQFLHRFLGEEGKADEFLAQLNALKGSVRPDFSRAPVGREVQDAYGNLGPYSMAIRDFDVPGPATPVARPEVTASAPADLAAWKAGALPKGAPFLGCAVLDFDRDGNMDLFVCGGEGPCALLRNDGGLKFTDVAEKAGVALRGVFTVAAGEFDVEPTPADARPCGRAKVDLVLIKADGLVFLRNQGDGTFADATEASGLGADPGGGRALLAFDADQEGDLDLFVAGAEGQGNRLWENAGPGKFREVAAAAGVAGDGKAYGPAAITDFDDDYDLDLVVTRPSAPTVIYSNDRALKFHEVKPAKPLPAAPYGVTSWGADLVLCGDTSAVSLRGTDTKLVSNSAGPAVAIDPSASGIVGLLFSDGKYIEEGSAVAPPPGGLRIAPGGNLVAFDADGDGVEEIVLVRPDVAPQAIRFECAVPRRAFVGDFEGVIKNDVQAGWSNLEGRGALVEVKAGARLSKFRIGNPSGFGCAAPTRLVAGLGSAKQADFVRVLWPDSVQQAVLDLPSGHVNCVVEEQRRPDSCPLLFSWDGERFAYVTDFLGVGGIGFLDAPGHYGQPDATESVKVDASLVKPRKDGKLAFRVVEAMEEVCYVDRADLQVIDHPAEVTVLPDERFAGEPPFPNGDLQAYRREILPTAARDRDGADVTDAVLRVDRRWPGGFRHHPRLVGATSDQALELDFGDRLAEVKPGDPLLLCLNGWIEYGYTRTTVAAAGEGFAYQLPTLEAWSEAKKAWTTLVPNLGYPAGFPRTMTYDVTGKVSRETPRLRIRTNFEIYWDRVWLAPKADAASSLRVTTLAPSSADLRWIGYPREVKPDGRDPPVYDYGTMGPSAPWKTVEGDYTRYGGVLPLLTSADDMYVIFGKGEEIELLFDPAKLPPLPEGWTRSYVLRFDGWCKGQELYTAHGFTVEPLPFHAMSNYPYGPAERYPDDATHRRYRAQWNTRRVGGAGR